VKPFLTSCNRSFEPNTCSFTPRTFSDSAEAIAEATSDGDTRPVYFSYIASAWNFCIKPTCKPT
jgi:hypothetical protein